MARAKKAAKKSAKTSSSSRKPQRKNIEARLKTVRKRQKSQRTRLLEELEQTPIMEAMLVKVGISKNTYYRWRKDTSFNAKCEEALAKGRERINDMAEKNILQAMHKGSLVATKFWLRHNSKRYGAKHTYEIFVHNSIDDEIELEHLARLAERVHAWKKKRPKVQMSKEEMIEMTTPRHDDLEED